MAAFQDMQATLQKVKGRTDKQQNTASVQYVPAWEACICVCKQTHTAVMSLTPPAVGQQRTGAHLGIFVHFQKTQCDNEGAKTRERPFTPFLSDV